MAKKTIYTCDKCGAEQLTKTQFWTLQITARTEGDEFESSVSGLMIEVCRECLEKYGIYSKQKPKQTTEENRVTIESIIKDLIDKAVT
jgi:hypothetical protein